MNRTEGPSTSDVSAGGHTPALVHTIEITPAATNAIVDTVHPARDAEAPAAGKPHGETTPADEMKPADPVKRASPGVDPRTVLVIDVGGTKVKMLATGQTEPIKFPSGKQFTPARLVELAQNIFPAPPQLLDED